MRNASGGVSVRTVTDRLGVFTFPRLASGQHQMTLGLPNNLSPVFANIGPINYERIPLLTIEHPSGGSAVCHVIIIVAPAGRISGLVKSVDSGPVDGWVNADSVTADDRPWSTIRSTVPAEDGKFVLDRLKPGRYSIQFTARDGFVPGVPVVIDLKDGERKTGMLLIARKGTNR